VRRREFIATLGGAATLAPLVLPSRDRVRRIGVLLFESNPTARTWIVVLRGALQKLGWIEGRNLRIDLRFGEADPDHIRASAEELVSFFPDLILTHSSPAANAVQKQTKTIPVVFVAVGDPVANGLVANVSRPNGNSTGFTNLFPSIGGKWLQLLKDAAPNVARVGLLFDPELFFSATYFGSVEAAGLQLAVQVTRIPYRSTADLEAIDAFAAEPEGGLIVLPPVTVGLFVRLAPYRLPTIGFVESAATAGALLSYGPDNADLFRGAASYVDRILRGAKPADLPVQFPTKFALVINLKTANSLGLAISRELLAQADEVVE
jgi:putative tryptophan/tyrosine transport system substrate-binding protein